MGRDEMKQLLITIVGKELNPSGVVVSGAVTTEEWVNHCLDPKHVDISLLGAFLRNSRDLPREQREAIIAYVRHKEHEAVDTAYDNRINQFERELPAEQKAHEEEQTL